MATTKKVLTKEALFGEYVKTHPKSAKLKLKIQNDRYGEFNGFEINFMDSTNSHMECLRLEDLQQVNIYY